MSADSLPAGRFPHELAAARRQAIDAWERADRALEATTRIAPRQQAVRLDLDRQHGARQREHAALLARSAELLELGGERLAVRAVLAHSDARLRDLLTQELTEAGVRIVGAFDDGADAAGAAVAEQPELVLLQDLLPTMDGLQVLRRVRTLVPGVVTGVHMLALTTVGCFVDGGVDVAFAARTTPADMARQLVDCLRRSCPAAQPVRPAPQPVAAA